MKLTPPQQELLDAMRAGTRVIFMRNGGSYWYFRTDTMKRCSNQARALEKAELVERYREDWRGYTLRPKP